MRFYSFASTGQKDLEEGKTRYGIPYTFEIIRNSGLTPFLCPNDNLSFGFTTPVRATIERTINGKTHLTVDMILKLSLIYH